MKSEKPIGIRRSIATRLLRIVFGIYLLVAISVTIGHMAMEYAYQKSSIARDLEDIQKTFEQVLAVDLWQLDDEGLSSTIEGILDIPAVVGIEVQNSQGVDVAVGGSILHDDHVGDVGQHTNLMGLSEEETAVHEKHHYTLDVFMHEFPLSYVQGDQTYQLGRATIYSNSSVVIRRVKLGFLLLVVNAIVKTAALWIIFLYFSNILLRKPLMTLASATENVSLENLDSVKIDVDTPGNNELKVLEDSFNTMIANLNNSVMERERAEEELRESEMHFKSLFEQAGDYILVLEVDEDKGLVVVYGNDAACQVH